MTDVEWVELWDGRRWPGRVRNGLPEFGFGLAPAGLSTRRQLRERGLCRGGQEPFARLVWQRERRFAWLYVDDRAKPKRTPSDAQRDAVDKALAARKVCAECGPVDHCVRTTDRLCGDCHAAGVTPQTDHGATWRVLHEWQAETARAAATDEQGDQGDELAPALSRAAEAAGHARAQADWANAEPHSAEASRDKQIARWHSADKHRIEVAEATGRDDYYAAGSGDVMEAGAA